MRAFDTSKSRAKPRREFQLYDTALLPPLRGGDGGGSCSCYGISFVDEEVARCNPKRCYTLPGGRAR